MTRSRMIKIVTMNAAIKGEGSVSFHGHENHPQHLRQESGT